MSTPVTALADEPAKTERLFEMRIYYPPEGKMAALQSRFRDHTVKLFAKHGMGVIGFWVERDPKDKKEKLIYILAHASKESADASWKAFRNDPVWQKAKADSEVNGTLVEKIDTIWMTPADYSPIR